MKQLRKGGIMLCFSLAVLASCSDGTNDGENASPATPGVQNVNGNVPDTQNSINLNGSQQQDSTYIKDSLRVKTLP